MKVLIDTNVILDVLCDRKDFVLDSARVWKSCEAGLFEGYVSALSIPNIVYIMRKELDPQRTQEIIAQLLLIFKITDLKSSDLVKAANMLGSDYEDAVQMCQAVRMKADFIATRNIRDLKESKIPALTPGELLKRI